MKSALVFSALFLSLVLSAQHADSIKIKASDPTQLYTFVEGYGGYNVAGTWQYGLYSDIWEAGFRGNWVIKNFRLGVFLPLSNVYQETLGLNDVSIDAGYQIHNNSGFYNSTLLNAGYSFGAEDNFFAIYDKHVGRYAFSNRSCFNKFYIT